MAKKESEYSKKLKDPRWQKKRLEILERDDWSCQKCSDTESTLVVHHRRYIYGKDPWDYPNYMLVTLCESCHETERETRQEYEDMLLEILKEKFFADDLYSLTCGFCNVKLKYPSEVFSNIMEWFLQNDDLVDKVSDLYFEDLNKKLEERRNASN